MRVFMGGMEQSGAANSEIWLREKCLVFLSLELQQIECALTHAANRLCVTADRGHILIFHGLLSSYRTPLNEKFLYFLCYDWISTNCSAYLCLLFKKQNSSPSTSLGYEFPHSNKQLMKTN